VSSRIRTRAEASAVGHTTEITTNPPWHTAARLSLPIRFVEPIVIAVDCVLVVSLSILTGIGYHWFFLHYVPNATPYVAVGVLAFSNISAILAARGAYQFQNLANLRRQMYDVPLTWTVVFLILLGIAFSLKVDGLLSRGATFGFFILGLSALLLWRFILAELISKALQKGAFAKRKIIVIGDQSRLSSSRLLPELQCCGYRPVNVFAISNTDCPTTGMPQTLEDTINHVIKLARQDTIHDIFLMIPWAHDRCIESIVDALSVLPLPVHLLPDEGVARYLNQRALRIGGTWAAELKRTPLTALEQALKRALDIIGASTGLIVLLPLMLITSVLIKIDTPGPILFTQKRIGLSGRSFRIYKFRTMSVLEDGAVIQQASRNDPRVTHVGRWIRRGSIDELPQLLNVLTGDMSLVGPRPHAVAHDDEYEPKIAAYAFRYQMKPGITGWAQINGSRGQTPSIDLMAKRIDLDLWYVNNWSIWLDLKIIFGTIVRELAFWRSNGY
jgi:Undecaprenyl-phosphate glucose phosphotransferase